MDGKWIWMENEYGWNFNELLCAISFYGCFFLLFRVYFRWFFPLLSLQFFISFLVNFASVSFSSFFARVSVSYDGGPLIHCRQSTEIKQMMSNQRHNVSSYPADHQTTKQTQKKNRKTHTLIKFQCDFVNLTTSTNSIKFKFIVLLAYTIVSYTHTHSTFSYIQFYLIWNIVWDHFLFGSTLTYLLCQPIKFRNICCNHFVR